MICETVIQVFTIMPHKGNAAGLGIWWTHWTLPPSSHYLTYPPISESSPPSQNRQAFHHGEIIPQEVNIYEESNLLNKLLYEPKL